MHSEAGLHLVHQDQSQPTPRTSRLSPPTSSISRKSRNQASKRHSKDDNQSQSTRDLDTLINGESSSKINTPSVNNNNNQQVGESLIEEETTTFHLASPPNREDESDIVVAGRQRQRDLASNRVSTSEARERTRHEHTHSSTPSTVSDSSIHSLSSSSPPPLSASTSTTPSSAASSIAPLFPRPAPFREEEPTSPCPSESASSLLSLSTFSSPTSSTYSVKKITAAKMTASTSSTTETTRRSPNAQHTRNVSNGSTASTTAGDREDNSNGNNNSLRLSSSSSAAARRSGRKSATPSAINIAAANNAASSSSKSTPNPSTSDSTSTSNTSAKQAIAISSALSGLLSPTSASNLTSAQQSALERALAAGISRDEFEKTRASVVSMLRGANASGSGGNGTPVQAQQQEGRRSVTPQPLLPASDSTSADNSFMQNASASDVAGSEETLAGASQRSFEALPKLAISTSSRREGGSSSRSNRYSGLNSASTSQTALSEQASTAPSTAASTLRTSVSSSNDAEDLHNLQDGGNDHESPATSDDGAGLDIGESMQADIDTKELVRQSTPVKEAVSSSNALGDPYEDVNMLSSSTKSVLSAGLDEDEEEDSSFNAATAAAAALGMLASSPVKVIERRQPSNYPITSTSQQQQQQQQQQPFMHGASGMFSQHRGHSTQHGLVSSSSPPLAAAAGRGSGNKQSLAGPQGLTRSSSGSNGHLYSSPPNRRGAGAAGAGGSSSRSPLDFNPGNSSNRNIGNDSSDLSAEGLVAAATLGASSVMASGGDRDKLSSTTTPVRTRLEDIALKSSAQIRRQREILGLGEEEMMDLDTDLRHENALLRGQFDNEDGEVIGREERFVDDDDEQVLLNQSPRKRQSSRRRQQQPQSGHLDERDLQQSGMGLQGLAPPFSYPYTSSSSSTASAGRQASRSPSRPVPNGREGRPAHGRTSSRQAAGPSSSTYFSPSKLASSHLPSSSAQASASSSTAVSGGGSSAPSTSRRRGQHHRRVSSYGMSGMMDRFMESNYSPKAAQIAKFEDAERRASPERERGHPVPSSSSAYDTDRTLMHATRDDDEEEEDEDVYYEDVEDEDGEGEREDVTVHSTPRTHMDKTRLLRSAGNDLPSPLLQQIRMLSDADNSPHHSAERPHRERETPRFARGPTGYSARQELGLSSGHASSSEFGSARKRKASYDLQSPRHMVRNVQASPTPEEDEDGDGRDPRDLRTALSPPPPFRNFAQSDAKFFERTTAGHPSSSGLFDGPTPSHSQSSSQSSAASYRLSQSQPQSSQHAQRHAYPQPHHQQQLHHSQQHPQVHHQHPQHAQQYARHYADDAHIPQPLYGHPSQQHPPSSAERHHPAYYQQYPRHLDGADELSHYALAPPRPPSHHHMHGNLQASQMSRPGSVNSDYIPNQRELKKKEKTMKKGQSAPRERQESVPSSIASGPVAAPSSSTAGTSTLDNFVPSNVQVGQYDEKTKPPFSYAALIGQAIFSTPNRRMSLADIYTYIMTLYPIYKKQDAGWQNSIRHNLSLNECFVKTQRGPDEPGKGCLWSIFPGTEEQFTGGNFYKKGKVPKSALRQSGGGGGGGPASSVAPSSNDGSGKRKKANSVASGTETMSVMSADDSFETQSANSFSYASNSSLMQSQGYADAQRPPHQYAQHPAYVHQAYPGQQYHPASQPHGPSSLRQKQQLQYSDEIEPEEVYEEEDDEAIDMDNPPPRYARPEQDAPRPAQRYQQGQEDDLHRAKLVVRPSKGVGDPKDETTALPPKRESSAEGEGEPMSQTASDYDGEDVFNATEAEHSYSNSDRSGSMEPVKRHQAMPHTSPVRRGNPYDRQRALLTSPPIMSSPPTNVFARMSQPYQPLRTSFNIPSSNAHAEALMSSPPPSSGIMPSDVRMRQLPPPTPRRASADGDEHAGSHIFLPAPNIKPGKSTFGKKEGTDEDAKPTLPPIHMMSPASAMALNTQSPVSSIRGSAAHNRSSSPSPKSSSLPSSSGNSITRSPTLNKSRQLHPSEVFKTPDRFAAPSSRTLNSPNKLAHLANNNASKALQSLQTPKLGTSRAGHGLVTPGGYYDPYEYGAVLDEELDRMMATNKDEGGRSDRRPLPFPSPIDRTPKWQPWSPW